MKEETLEEAACIALGYEYDYWIKLHSKDQSSLVYIEVTNWCKGAKWQQEKMYSEEEVIELLQNCWSESAINLAQQVNNEKYITFSEWVEKNL